MGRKILGCIKKLNPQLQFLGIPSLVGTQVLKGIQDLCEGALCHGVYIDLCSLKLQSVQRIILDRWLRKALPILYILSPQIDIQSCLFAKYFFFFFPNHFLRLAGVYPPGCALKISANKKEGAWLNHQRNPAAHTQAIRNLPSLRDPGEENSPRMWHTESSPQPATESSSCLLLPSDSVTPLICLCGCLFAAEWINSCS